MSTSSNLRSSSVGAAPRPRLHRPSRAESAAALALDVRCACQFFQTTSLMPERVNPVGFRPPSSIGSYVPQHFMDNTHSLIEEHDMSCEYFEQKDINLPNEDFRFGPVGHTDYYAESVTSRPSSPSHTEEYREPDGPLTMMIPENLAQQSFHSPELSNQNMTDTLTETEHFIKQKDPNTSIVLKRRSSSRTSADRLAKQRDPSSSSILRKRMNLSKTNLGDNAENIESYNQTGNVDHTDFNDHESSSNDRFLHQRDPSQSSILRRKMLIAQQTPPILPLPNPYYMPNTSAVTLASQLPAMDQDNYTSDDPYRNKGSDRKSRLDDMLTRKSKANQPEVEQNPPQTTNPLALSLVSSRSTRYIQRSVENIPVKFADSEKSIDRLSSIENIPSVNKRDLSPNTVNKLPEKQSINVNKIQSVATPVAIKNEDFKKVTESEPVLKRKDDVEMMKAPSHQAQRLSIQSFSIKPQTIKRSLESFGSNEEQPLASEYIQSKVFENYDFSTKNISRPRERTTSPVQIQRNISPSNEKALADSHDTHEDNKPTYIKQRDPSTSSFTRNRYKTPEPSILLTVEATPPSANDIKSLPSAGDFPERRASEQCTMIKQKDLTTSTLLNRRRRNLSQTNLNVHNDSLSPISAGGKIVKTVSFEFDKQLLSEPYQNIDERRASSVLLDQSPFDQIEQTYKLR